MFLAETLTCIHFSELFRRILFGCKTSAAAKYQQPHPPSSPNTQRGGPTKRPFCRDKACLLLKASVQQCKSTYADSSQQTPEHEAWTDKNKCSRQLYEECLPPPPAPKPSDSLDLSLALQAGRMASTIMPQEAANTRYITLSLSIATKFT